MPSRTADEDAMAVVVVVVAFVCDNAHATGSDCGVDMSSGRTRSRVGKATALNPQVHAGAGVAFPVCICCKASETKAEAAVTYKGGGWCGGLQKKVAPLSSLLGADNYCG